jgi:hypothetical protein
VNITGVTLVGSSDLQASWNSRSRCRWVALTNGWSASQMLLQMTFARRGACGSWMRVKLISAEASALSPTKLVSGR